MIFFFKSNFKFKLNNKIEYGVLKQILSKNLLSDQPMEYELDTCRWYLGLCMYSDDLIIKNITFTSGSIVSVSVGSDYFEDQ